MSAPEHVRKAVVNEKASDVPATLDRLHKETLETALYLTEGDFGAAARSAYRAAWFWQKLPADEQKRYVETELVDDTGPVDSGDEWSGAAFAVWLVYRCNRLATAYGRNLSALGERADDRRTADLIEQERRVQAPRSVARPTFAGFDAVDEKKKERLQS